MTTPRSGPPGDDASGRTAPYAIIPRQKLLHHSEGHDPGIRSHAWVINQSLLASGTANPTLVRRGGYEAAFIERVGRALSPRTALIPWQATIPVGADGLRGLVG